MNEAYKNLLDKHNEGQFLNSLQLYDYQINPVFEQVYDAIYESCNQHLLKVCTQIGIPVLSIAFDKEDSPTGIFRPHEKCITYSNGMIENLAVNVYCDVDEVINKFGSPDARRVIERTGLPAQEVLITLSTVIIHYHETGHLIQHIDETSKELKSPQQPFLVANNIPWTYLTEIDADWMAMDQLVKGAIEKYMDGNGNWINGGAADLEGYLSLGLAVLVNFLYRAMSTDYIYCTEEFRSKTHPHPIIRVEMIKQNLAPMLSKFLPVGITIDHQKILIEARQLTIGMFEAEKLFEGDLNFILDIERECRDNETQVQKCIEKLLNAAKGFPELAQNGKAARLGVSNP